MKIFNNHPLILSLDFTCQCDILIKKHEFFHLLNMNFNFGIVLTFKYTYYIIKMHYKQSLLVHRDFFCVAL